MKDNTFQTKRVSFFERHLITAAALGAEMAYVVGPGAQASPELLSKDAKEELPADFPLLTFRDPEAFFAAHTPTTRKVTCTSCGTNDWCTEVSAEKLGSTEPAIA